MDLNTLLRALSLESGIQDAYYWITVAAEVTRNSMMKERYDQMAKEELPEEEYLKVQNRWRYERIRKNKNN